MRVIITRPAHQAEAWIADLRRHGISAESLPLIAIEPVADPTPLRAAWARLPTIDLTLFVSANAVRQFMAAQAGTLQQAPEKPLRWPTGRRAAATGPGTAAALMEAGMAPEQITQPPADAAQFDTETLWEALKHEPWAGRQVLIVRGEDGRNWLAEQLRERGALVDFVVAYRRTTPEPDPAGRALLQAALAEPGAHLWLFSSSEAVGNLRQIDLSANWHASAALATHPRIAEAARAAGFGDVAVTAPTLQAVRAACMARGLGRPEAGASASANATAQAAAAPAAAPAPTIRAAVNQPLSTSHAPMPESTQTPAASARHAWRWIYGVALLVALALAAGAGLLAWTTQHRLRSLESELVKRQRDSAGEAAEARVLARQAETAARESSARVALIDARVAESTLQRGQLDEMMQALARTREENVVADLEAALRVAQQQAAITNSAEPLVLMLKQASERLARLDEPRLVRVRQAVLHDLERTRNAAGADIGSLALRIDEVVRQIDELPLLAMPDRLSRDTRDAPATPAAPPTAAQSDGPAADAAAEEGVIGRWATRANAQWQRASSAVWQEIKSLVRVTPITQPDAVLLTPEQGLFLRENLKLRLLNARLALLSRQYELAQSDLLRARSDLQRYFDRSARRVQGAAEALREAAAQSRQISVPQPDATIAALTAAAAPAGR